MKEYPKVQKPEKFIKACRKLINNYEQSPYFLFICPLCVVSFSIMKEDWFPCVVCPWRVLGWKGHKTRDCYATSRSSSRKENIRRLKFWIKIMEKQIRDAEKKE